MLVNNMKIESWESKKKVKEEVDHEKELDKMRKYMDTMRPPLVWNFFYDGDESIDHELRPYVDPTTCY
jgi:hypothetical protein